MAAIDERDAAEHGGEDAGAPLAGAFEKTLHGERALAADQLIELADDLPADGLGAEDHARNGGGDEQDGRDRKQRVVGERRAEAEGIVVPPGPQRGPEYRQDRRRAHEHHS